MQGAEECALFERLQWQREGALSRFQGGNLALQRLQPSPIAELTGLKSCLRKTRRAWAAARNAAAVGWRKTAVLPRRPFRDAVADPGSTMSQAVRSSRCQDGAHLFFPPQRSLHLLDHVPLHVFWRAAELKKLRCRRQQAAVDVPCERLRRNSTL